jgi:hypothetical protein
MRNPPLCQLNQLTQTGPGTYDIDAWADFTEAMLEEDEYAARLRPGGK